MSPINGGTLVLDVLVPPAGVGQQLLFQILFAGDTAQHGAQGMIGVEGQEGQEALQQHHWAYS